jgi:hypothetical protein
MRIPIMFSNIYIFTYIVMIRYIMIYGSQGWTCGEKLIKGVLHIFRKCLNFVYKLNKITYEKATTTNHLFCFY